jgi:hypothetical protein
VVVLDADEPHVVVAGHHAAVDGLGLVALLSVVLDAPLATNARGLDPARMPRSATLAYRARRLIEAALAPPARIAPHSGEADAAATGPGDHLTGRRVATQLSTSRLVAAAARGVRRWNAAAGEAAEPLVVAVGASLRPGTEARLADLAARSAWFRLRIDRADPEEIAAKLARDAPEPRPSGRGVGPATLRLSRALASRLGSTLLVSNIGRMDGSGRVRRAALYPAAHGRSGVSIGCAAVGTEALVTLRARKSSFSARVAGSLLDVVVEELERLP